MKKLVLAATVAALALAAPAQAHVRSGDGGSKSKGSAGQHGLGGVLPRTDDAEKKKGKHGASNCKPRPATYIAFGAYVESALTQTKGADTPDDKRDDRYSGSLTVDVKHANRWARPDKGTKKVYTLTDARVRFADRNGDDKADPPVAGDRTIVFGKTTRLHKKCDQTGFVPTLTVRRVMFLPPPSPTPPAPAPPA